MNTTPIQPASPSPENLQPSNFANQDFLTKAAALTVILDSLQQLLIELKTKEK